MGNSGSSFDENDLLDPFDGIDTLGYRVLGVQPESPASKAGLVSFLDFLVGANGKMLLGSGEGLQEGEEYDDVDLPALLEEHKGKELELLVWNIKSQQERLVTIVPNDDWGGAGLLGVTIRLDNYAGADERLIRILSVEPQSPAAVAGLVAEKDFLLGTTHETLETTSNLSILLQHHQDQVVEFYVYNTDSDVVRTVALMPTLSWGGRGLLGAEVGVGYLHRLPSKTRYTEGASVERKVRYVGVSQKDTTSTTNPQSKAASGTVLELEPQLEMEASPEEGDDHLMAAAAPVLEEVKLTPMKPATQKEETIVEPPQPESHQQQEEIVVETVVEDVEEQEFVQPVVENREEPKSVQQIVEIPEEQKTVQPAADVKERKESKPVEPEVQMEIKEEPKPVELSEAKTNETEMVAEGSAPTGESTANPAYAPPPPVAPPAQGATPAHAAFAMPPPMSVFSKPTPQGPLPHGPPRPVDASIPVSAAVLPPPPKMHYDTPPKATTNES